MYEVVVIDKASGEVIKNIECVGFNIQYSRAEDDGRIHKARNLLNAKYDFRYWVKNEFYTPIAQKLKDSIEEFKHIDHTKILFIEDVDAEEDINKTSEWVFKISKVNKNLRILTGYSWIVESKECWVNMLSRSYIVAHIYSMMKIHRYLWKIKEIWLGEEEGLTFKEIGEIFGVSKQCINKGYLLRLDRGDFDSGELQNDWGMYKGDTETLFWRALQGKGSYK